LAAGQKETVKSKQVLNQPLCQS